MGALSALDELTDAAARLRDGDALGAAWRPLIADLRDGSLICLPLMPLFVSRSIPERNET
jgi:hypothetical protein